MGRAAFAALVLLLCAGALGRTGAAARTHESFATSTYYPDKVTTTDGQLPNAEQLTGDLSTNIPNRYPNGYPFTVSNNPQSSQLSVQNKESGSDPAGERYPRGYYPTSQYTQGSNLPASRSTDTASYAALDSQHAGTIPNRYPTGYPTGTHNLGSNPSYNAAQYSSLNNQPLVNPAGERYPHGYYPNSQYAGSSHQANPSGTSSYFSQSVNPGGYYPNSQDIGSNFQQYNGVPYSNQVTNGQKNVDTFGERYSQGYYPNSQSGQSVPRTVSYSDQGSFNSLPYGSNAGELPFELTGAGCRTEYWIQNVAKWPAFLNVKSTVEDAFGSKAKATYGETTLLQGLMKVDTDPYSELLKSGCTAILNAYSRGGYSMSHMQVIEEFNAGLVSKDSAATQALAFETANVESISAGNACT